MAKASGLIDLKAIGDASKVATNCIFEVSNNGIWVTPANYKPDSNGDPITTTSGTKIDNTGVGIYSAGVNVAQYGVSARVGVESSGHTILDSSGMTIKKGTTTLATFGATAQLGASNTGHVDIASTGVDLYRGTVELAHFGFASGNNGSGGGTNAPYYTMGTRHTYEDNYPIGIYSFVEGYDNVARGAYSHAEGNMATAGGKLSHAQGECVTANGYCETVIGRYNEKSGSSPQDTYNQDRGYILVLGNGTSLTALSNAFTVDWYGVVNAKGGYKVAGHTPIVIETVSDDNLTINANNNYTWNKTGLSKTGYTLAGIVGYGVTNASSSGGNSSLCNVFLCQVSSSSSITMYVRNTGSAAANVKLSANLMWVANGMI